VWELGERKQETVRGDRLGGGGTRGEQRRNVSHNESEDGNRMGGRETRRERERERIGEEKAVW